MTSLYVLFKVAQSDYVLDAADVLLMESFTGATQVPGSPAHLVGIVQSSANGIRQTTTCGPKQLSLMEENRWPSRSR